ncbi:N-acetyltransferase (plasmid) [Marinobacter sp. M3C]|uniref:N-acetyltransferase n=1 Tax=Marinobacter sp. M3C TaxID=2917715 RepID=UPI00200DBAEB|nr:N-acetyltransferase [Marinobacter sp. M3C]UQG62668.1 N-acetyltransferase [Marinobacter sp. M3C]
MKIETITKQHDRKNFDCGHEELNNYLRSTARQSDTKRSTRTWVLVDDDVPTAILGYITLVPSEQNFPEDSKAARKFGKNVPIYRLAKLAVEKNQSGNGFGHLLLTHAIHLAVIASESVGGTGVVFDCKNSDVVGFYMRYTEHFMSISDDGLTLWLPITVCAKIVNC